jgi:hypothetical protein
MPQSDPVQIDAARNKERPLVGNFIPFMADALLVATCSTTFGILAKISRSQLSPPYHAHSSCALPLWKSPVTP